MSNDSDTEALRKAISNVVKRSSEDAEFYDKVLADPKGAVESELGRKLPEDLSFRAVPQTKNQMVVPLPPVQTKE